MIGLVVVAGLLLAGWLAYRYAGLLFDPLYPALGLIFLVGAATFYVYRRVELQRGEMPGRLRPLRFADGGRRIDRQSRQARARRRGARDHAPVLRRAQFHLDLGGHERARADDVHQRVCSRRFPRSSLRTAAPSTNISAMRSWRSGTRRSTSPSTRGTPAMPALDMAARMDELNRDWRERATAAGRKFALVKIGIGVNTGNCCVGNLGSAQRFDYSAIGDEVNVASRFEGLSKTYGVTAIAGERTIGDSGPFPALELDLVRVKGRVQPAANLHAPRSARRRPQSARAAQVAARAVSDRLPPAGMGRRRSGDRRMPRAWHRCARCLLFRFRRPYREFPRAAAGRRLGRRLHRAGKVTAITDTAL